MVYLLDSDAYSDDELGTTLYRVLSIAVERPEPYNLLSEEERQYYEAAGRDFITYLRRHEGRNNKQRRKRLWYFDFNDNTAKQLFMYCTTPKEPERWVVSRGKSQKTFILGKDAFLHEDDALQYGRETLIEFARSTTTIVERLADDIQEAAARRDANYRALEGSDV